MLYTLTCLKTGRHFSRKTEHGCMIAARENGLVDYIICPPGVELP